MPELFCFYCCCCSRRFSINFDETVLNDSIRGGGFLLMGLAFAVLVSEGILLALKMRLPFMYRAPYYAILSLLFLWPIPLGELSLRGEHQLMSWGVYLFPWVGGVLMLTLLPAARLGRNEKRPNGTPWRWPLYPWSLFAVLWMCLVLRSFSLSMAFEMSGARGVSFQAYFLLPLVVAAAAVLWQLGIAAGSKATQWFALTTPLVMLAFALPGEGVNVVQTQFLLQLCDVVASPLQMTIFCLIGLYGAAWVQGQRGSEAVLMVLVFLAAMVDHQTVTLATFAQPWTLPWELLAVCQFVLGLLARKSWRITVGCALGGLSLWWRFAGTSLPTTGGYVPIHLLLLTLLLLGLFFNDRLAKVLRQLAIVVMPVTALLTVVAYDWFFPNVASWWHVQIAAVLAAIAVGYWFRQKSEPYMVCAMVTAMAWLAALMKRLYLLFDGTPLERGRDWLTWGLLLLALALVISLYKGGQLRGMWSRMRIVNRRLRRRSPS